MKTSVIVAVYQDIEALDLILHALKHQTYTNIEVVVAEDGESELMHQYLKSVEGIEIVHTTQPDIGNRKSRSQNNAILASSGEYLIFIDGDCIPYSTFVEGHVSSASDKTVLSGRRVNLGASYSKRLRGKQLSSLALEKNYWLKYFDLSKDENASHIEQGIYVGANNQLFKLLTKNRSTSILGCNFSLYKEMMVAIDGFDEQYAATSIGDDTDLSWRFAKAGYRAISCKNLANLFHLDHARQHFDQALYETKQAFMLQRKELGDPTASIGLSTHQPYSHLAPD